MNSSLSGCESGKYGENCMPCEGCETCDITSGQCGKLKYKLIEAVSWLDITKNITLVAFMREGRDLITKLNVCVFPSPDHPPSSFIKNLCDE